MIYIDCPYCEKSVSVDTSDFDGAEKDVEVECAECKKNFVVDLYLEMYAENARKADCLNGDAHTYKPTATSPEFMTEMVCGCGLKRWPTDSEWLEILGMPRAEYIDKNYPEYSLV